MKYPSVFLAILFVWITVVSLAVILNDKTLTFNLFYLSLIAFTIIIFIIGFWRNN